MSFVPEGQHDSSQALSAWNHEENSLVPAGRLNGSRLRLDANNSASTSNMSGTDNGTDKGTDNDFDRPSVTGALYVAIQALRAWLLSRCPSGTKDIRPSKGFASS